MTAKKLEKVKLSESLKNTYKLIKAVSSLNAFTTVVDASAPTPKGSQKLYGIPVAIKDNFSTKGIRTTCASNMLKEYVPTFDATVVQKIIGAGGIIIGKTNMDEFSMGSGCVDSIFGPVRNIWGSHLAHNLVYKNGKIVQGEVRPEEEFCISGGSSGGSTVAVASGICPAAIGSDTGGSMRIPASYCGVIGFKPSYGLVSRYGLISLVNSMDVPGIAACNVETCVNMLDVICGIDIRDSTTVNSSLAFDMSEKLDIATLSIGVPEEYYCDQMSDHMVEVWSEVLKIFEKSGARIKKVRMPYTSYSIPCYSILTCSEVASNYARYDGIRYGHRCNNASSTEELFSRTRHEGFNEVVRGRILAGNYFILKSNYENYFERALKLRRLICEDFKKVWQEGIDILITPITLSEAPRYKDFIIHDNREQVSIQDYCSQPANMSGVPAISVPIKLSSQGLPLSIQLMGQRFKDDLLLNTAYWLEHQVDFPSVAVQCT